MSNKVTIKVRHEHEVRIGDSVCELYVNRVPVGEDWVRASSDDGRSCGIPFTILQALCSSGHVTREVDASDAVEWVQSGAHHSARFDDKIVGVVVTPNPLHEPYFKVYDHRFTDAIKAKLN